MREHETITPSPEEVATEPWGDLAGQELPRLYELSERLIEFVEEIFAEPIDFTSDNGADRMVLSLVTKQTEHLRSVRVLIESRQHRDAYLISRAMFEAMVTLMWAFRDVPKRTDRWFWFGAILDYRQVQANLRNGVEVAPEVIKLSGELVAEHGPNYPKKRKRRKSDPDGWADDWLPNGVSVRSMSLELKGEKVYDVVYRDTSEWIHSGPRAILRATDETEGPIWFSTNDWRSAVAALRTSCHALSECLFILNNHFKLNLREQLSSLDARLKELTLADSNPENVPQVQEVGVL